MKIPDYHKSEPIDSIVFLPPSLYEAAAARGYDMTWYRPQGLLPKSPTPRGDVPACRPAKGGRPR